MRKILIIICLFLVLTTISVGKDGRERQLNITSLDIKFDKTNAIFTLNYNFDPFPKFYLIMIGSKTLEPKIKSIFSNFDYEIIKIDDDKTILKVKNVSRLDKGYYLHDSVNFGDTINVLYISDSSKRREYFNLTATPNYFYR